MQDQHKIFQHFWKACEVIQIKLLLKTQTEVSRAFRYTFPPCHFVMIVFVNLMGFVVIILYIYRQS